MSEISLLSPSLSLLSVPEDGGLGSPVLLLVSLKLGRHILPMDLGCQEFKSTLALDIKVLIWLFLKVLLQLVELSKYLLAQ